MKQRRFFIAFFTALFAICLNASAVLAFPSLPSSFYGTVQNNRENVAEGIIIEAFINDQLVAQGFTQMYEGDSVYSLDINGDDADTPAQDGGKEGDTIVFKVGGVAAEQTGVWHTGTNIPLDLSVKSSSALAGANQAQAAALPTQTAIPYAEAVRGTNAIPVTGGSKAETNWLLIGGIITALFVLVGGFWFLQSKKLLKK